MNSLNDFVENSSSSSSLTSERKMKNQSQVDFQEKVLLELSQPLPTQPQRVRKPLSKFTISSSPSKLSHGNSNSSNSSVLIPAYRTCAHESLPVVSPADLEERRNMNILPFSSRMPSRDYHSSPSAAVSSNSTKNALRAKQLKLQRKTIHRSLEDLRNNIKNQHDSLNSSDRLSSPPKVSSSSPRKTFPVPMSSSTKHSNSQGSEVAATNSSSSRATSSELYQINSAEKIINRSKGIFAYDCVVGGENMSNSINSHLLEKSGTNENESLHNASQMNSSIKQKIATGRQEGLFYRIIISLVCQAMKRRSLQIKELDEELQRKRQECAARIVLHHLLLNSWRRNKIQLHTEKKKIDAIHKTIDNQSLQLNIVRKMQSMGKEQILVFQRNQDEMQKKYYQVIRDNEAIKEEHAKVVEEKSSLEGRLRSLSDENSRLHTDLQVRLDKREMQMKGLELDRLHAQKFLRENEQLAIEAQTARCQIEDLLLQCSHWQEKTITLETNCYELKLDMKRKEEAYEKVLFERIQISKENETLSRSNSSLEKAVEEFRSKLKDVTVQKTSLEKSYNECLMEVESLEDQLHILKTAISKYRQDYRKMKEKWLDCTSKNVHRRRVWGAALYFFVNPFEAVKRFFYGAPEPPPSLRYNIIQPNSITKTERIGERITGSSASQSPSDGPSQK